LLHFDFTSKKGCEQKADDAGRAANLTGVLESYQNLTVLQMSGILRPISMRRRTALQWLAGLVTAGRGWAQTAPFPGNQAAALRNLAALVLPASLGPAGTDGIAEGFEQYVREYRPGADTEHGYGFTRVRPKPPSPAPAYLRQLAALPVPLTREAVETALEAAQIKDLPRLPDGSNLIADLMSFYFRSADANDLCYRAAIQREACRGLAGSSNAPLPLKERA
jgi:hypothetical protein